MSSKKGVFFTFIAIFTVILIVAVVSTRDTYRYREKSNAISSRIRTMNNFISDFEKDIDRELFIGGYRALLSMNSYLRMVEGYVNDFDAVIAEILENGTANGTTMVLMGQGTLGADLNSWLSRVNEEASKLNINVSLVVHNITMSQTSPWVVTLILNATVTIDDMKGLASWNFDKLYTRDFSILGFEDPLFLVETQDKVTNLINQSPNMDFVNDTDNDTTVLNTHLSYSYYVESTSAPSFLMRYKGNLSGSPYGIECMVNLEDLNAQSIPIMERSVIDYIYFGSEATTDYCNVTDMPGWFRVDSSHLASYEVDKLEKQLCP